MAELLFREQPYLKSCEATVVAVHGDAVELDRTVFYPLGGGQAGDIGKMSGRFGTDRKSTRLNSSHVSISYAVFCLKKKKNENSTKAHQAENAYHADDDAEEHTHHVHDYQQPTTRKLQAVLLCKVLDPATYPSLSIL